MSGCYLLAWSQICKSGRWGKGKGAAAAARHSVAMPIAGMGADFQDREAGQGNGGCSGRQPGTASGCHLLAWGQICKTGRWCKGKRGCGRSRAQLRNVNCRHGDKFASAGGGARAVAAAGHSVALPIAGVGGDLQEREVGQGEGGLRRAAAGQSVGMPNAGMGADLQDREVGQGEDGLHPPPGTASGCQVLAWGQTCKSGRWGKGKGGCARSRAQRPDTICWHGGRFARPGGGARARGAADAAGHRVTTPNAGMGADL